MLYILFGKDKIGKKTVRDRLAQRFGITIIPKFTCDITNSWRLHYQKSSYLWEDSPVEIKFDSDDSNHIANKIKDHCNMFAISPYSKYYLRRCDDPFLKFLLSVPNEKDFLYDIKKNIGGEEKRIQYLIKREHIRRALLTTNQNFILVCASGDVIDKIFSLQKELKDKIGNNAVAEIRQVFVDGSPRETKQNHSTWNSNPADYFLKNSYKFIKITNRTCLKDGSDDFDELKFNEMLDKQWINKTRMLPIKISCFVVRPFSDVEHKGYFNENDLCYNSLITYINNVKENISGKTREIIFERLDDNGSNIFSQISTVINKSQLVIVDLRGHRPNCYYEYGYAQALADMLNFNYGNENGKIVIGILGTIVDERSTTKYDEEINSSSIIKNMDLQLKNIWTNIRSEENKKAFDTTQFAHYKYVCKIVYDYDRVGAEFIPFNPDGNEPTFDDKLINLLKLDFEGINALVEE
ncbi:MAG: hypothetical protein J1F31_05925 [Erysipelotrichales bacterium]|nr:hypothetical protein [Erysipelotrichales bacterium]